MGQRLKFAGWIEAEPNLDRPPGQRGLLALLRRKALQRGLKRKNQ